MTETKGAEEARNKLPQLLDAAERGSATLITKRGRRVAALVPIAEYEAIPRRHSLLSLAGTGRGLWGEDSTRMIRALKDEWDR